MSLVQAREASLSAVSHPLGTVGGMWFERRCAACDRPGTSPCAACIAALRPASDGACPTGLASCRSLFDYDERGRDLVVALKYRNRRDLAAVLGAGMAALVGRAEIDLVTWAPTSSARRADRGYDQSRLLAVVVARALGLPCARLLRRSGDTPQTGLALAERCRGPSFVLRRPPSGRLLVVDDVVTTGATLSAAGRSLLDAGGASVHGLTAARTPLKLGRAEVDNEVRQASPSRIPP
jgi:predicted amidophosphoribosyltransferase